MSALELRDLSFRAGNRDIVDGVNLSVAPGETLALLGPSGSGKTTLLRLIAGLERPSAGSIAFGADDITRLPAHRRRFGMMFQDHALFPHLDAGMNVEFGLRMAGIQGAARASRASELLGLVGLAGFERRSIEKLSGGERQRVALARTLAPSPRLLMLDEPLASLDRGLRERLAGELRIILENLAVPTLYVTHDRFEAFSLASRLAILDHGRIVRAGTPRDIWADPQTEFVARFLGLDNIVHGNLGPDRLVETAFGRFGPVQGRPGPVRLLLRTENTRLAGDAPAPNTAGGTVARSLFRGDECLVTLAAGTEAIEVPLPSGQDFRVGQQLFVTVTSARLVEPGGGGG